MTKLTLVSVGVLTLLLALTLAVGGLGLAVREGMLTEQTLWLPPQSKYQLIVRIGPDTLPWAAGGNRTRATAINVWLHGRGTAWHLIKLLGIPLGTSPQPTQRV